MTKPLPRIASTTPVGPTLLGVTWGDGRSERVDLAGWIATGGDGLRPLADPAIFATARPDEHGAAVAWGSEDGDLAIDAGHLRLIAEEQRRFGAADLAAWQAEVGLSDAEAADFLSVSIGTWNAYRAGSVPMAVGMVCRAALRDPILLQAHYRPQRATSSPAGA